MAGNCIALDTIEEVLAAHGGSHYGKPNVIARACRKSRTGGPANPIAHTAKMPDNGRFAAPIRSSLRNPGLAFALSDKKADTGSPIGCVVAYNSERLNTSTAPSSRHLCRIAGNVGCALGQTRRTRPPGSAKYPAMGLGTRRGTAGCQGPLRDTWATLRGRVLCQIGWMQAQPNRCPCDPYRRFRLDGAVEVFGRWGAQTPRSRSASRVCFFCLTKQMLNLISPNSTELGRRTGRCRGVLAV